LQGERTEGGAPLTAVFAQRSLTAFAGVLGALLAGDGYVPLNPSFPIERSRAMLVRSDCRSLIVDAGALDQLDGLLEAAVEALTVLLPEGVEAGQFAGRWPEHRFVPFSQYAPADSWRQPDADPDAVAYLLFTSGSTGAPKGVMVAHRNVRAFVDYMVGVYGVSEHDRFSQMFDMTFDLSVFDMFVCWERGAMLCCPSKKTLIKPGQFIADHELTIWFSTPSTAIFMKQLEALKAGRYPSLRLSLFCGEPLPASSVVSWREAAPKSIIENLYGPTELTIACTRYRWDDKASPNQCELGVVPIGDPYPGMEVLVAGEDLVEVDPGATGELLMRGPQMTPGYWRDPAKTSAAFVVPPGRDAIFYRTGDRVRRADDAQPMTHLGRTDHQVKVLGYRVELGEIEAVLRDCARMDGVVAVGWPATSSGFGGVEAFVEAPSIPPDLRERAAAILPEYMVPRRIHALERLPRNSNGKYDRISLVKMLELGL
jgi:amino acid adenylation domain-containing protein